MAQRWRRTCRHIAIASVFLAAAGCWKDRGVPPGVDQATTIAVNSNGTVLVAHASSGGTDQAWILRADNEWVSVGVRDPEASSFEPVGLSDDETVVGNSVTYGPVPSLTVPFIWTPSEGLQDLADVLGEAHDEVTGISDDGHIVGNDSPPYTQPWLWDPTTQQSRELAPLPGYPAALAAGVNSQGWVIGQSIWGPANSTPTVWVPPSYAPAELTVGDADFGQVTGIDDAGTMAGYIGYNDGDPTRSRAVVWDDASPHPIRSLSGPQVPGRSSFGSTAGAIDDGVVIGHEEGCVPETPICGGIWYEVAWNAETLERVDLYGDGISNDHPWFVDLNGDHMVGNYPYFQGNVVSRGRPSV